MCAGINHALQVDLIIILELCVMKNDNLQDLFSKNVLIYKYIDLGRPMIKMCIPHTLIDLGLAD